MRGEDQYDHPDGCYLWNVDEAEEEWALLGRFANKFDKSFHSLL